jgi:hypothetical protein
LFGAETLLNSSIFNRAGAAKKKVFYPFGIKTLLSATALNRSNGGMKKWSIGVVESWSNGIKPVKTKLRFRLKQTR